MYSELVCIFSANVINFILNYGDTCGKEFIPAFVCQLNVRCFRDSGTEVSDVT